MDAGMVVFKALQESHPSVLFRCLKGWEMVGVCGTIHGSDNEVKAPQGQALYCCSGVSRTQHSPGRGAFAGWFWVCAP